MVTKINIVLPDKAKPVYLGRRGEADHFGDPFVLDELSHIPRIIIGRVSPDSVNAAIEVLVGDNQAKGVLTYDVNFK